MLVLQAGCSSESPDSESNEGNESGDGSHVSPDDSAFPRQL